jgi:hypothetical protein
MLELQSPLFNIRDHPIDQVAATAVESRINRDILRYR